MKVDWGGLRRRDPISREFGFDRGTPIDRYYIGHFLRSHSADIRGRVLEIGDDTYTRTFGSPSVATRDILHVSEFNPHATIIGDLARDETLPQDAFDCAIITQTLHLIFEPRRAVTNLHRSLKPGGVLLVSVPGITPISIDEWKDSWYWSFTRQSIRRMFSEVFGAQAVDFSAYGNVFAATCFLQGVAVEDVDASELDVRDPCYELLLCVRAQKR